MDFTLASYTQEQERFRLEVRTWLEENVPDDMKDPIDGDDFTYEQYQFYRELWRKMGEKGWLFPTYPKEYGGGGMSADYEVIITEEMSSANVKACTSRSLVFQTLLVWGTEEQKQQFLPPLLRGDAIVFQKLTEPQGGADLASIQSRATQDGDDWILNGSNIFIGDPYDVEYIAGPMVTDPDAPRHRNLGYFMIPVPSEGLELREMKLLPSSRKQAIFLDNVRVSGEHLIGGVNQGWQVMGTHLEFEHGGRGRAVARDENTDSLIEYLKETKHDGGTLGGDEVVQQVAMDAVLDAHVQGLLLQRTYWMYQNRMEIQYEGNVANVHGRESSLRNARRIRELYGPYGFLGTKEPGAPHGGAQEVNQRSRAGQNHAAGSTNIAKVILARRIGISRTQERAAPTASTATAHSS